VSWTASSSRRGPLPELSFFGPSLDQLSRPSAARTSVNRPPLTVIAWGETRPTNTGTMGRRMRTSRTEARSPGPAHAACGTRTSRNRIVGVKEKRSTRSTLPSVTGRPNCALRRSAISPRAWCTGKAPRTSSRMHTSTAPPIASRTRAGRVICQHNRNRRRRFQVPAVSDTRTPAGSAADGRRISCDQAVGGASPPELTSCRA
jgi:hypothetical protein